MSYLILQELDVSNLSANNDIYTIHLAPLFALKMFVENLSLKTGVGFTDLAVIMHSSDIQIESLNNKYGPQHVPVYKRGTSLYTDILSNYQKKDGTYKDANLYEKQSDYSGKSIALQPTVSANATYTLIIKYDDYIDIDHVTNFLMSARISGGNVIYRSKNDISRRLISIDDWELAEHLKQIPFGYFFVERSDLMSNTHQTPLDNFIQCLGNREHAWLSPCIMGYAAITDFKGRVGARIDASGQSAPHAYAEPLLGLIQFVPTTQFKNSPLPFFEDIWLQDDVFVIRQINSGENHE